MKKKVTVCDVFLLIALIFAIIGLFTGDYFWFIRAIIICIGVWIGHKVYKKRNKKEKKVKKK